MSHPSAGAFAFRKELFREQKKRKINYLSSTKKKKVRKRKKFLFECWKKGLFFFVRWANGWGRNSPPGTTTGVFLSCNSFHSQKRIDDTTVVKRSTGGPQRFSLRVIHDSLGRHLESCNVQYDIVFTASCIWTGWRLFQCFCNFHPPVRCCVYSI